LLWTAPRLRTPEQFQRWTDIVAAARNQLVVARDAVAAQRYPWEAQKRAATPRQVRRAMNQILTPSGDTGSTPRKIAGAASRHKGQPGAALCRDIHSLGKAGLTRTLHHGQRMRLIF
jgi:hypothetical protein